ncbi:divergent protein kinase domain 1C-like [Lineus longissimus]|uniref:divergent protein kinase domain 1C-like n=1 Tax=Lineus longissimus TaxID=88925 RepID=UPI002B4F08F1
MMKTIRWKCRSVLKLMIFVILVGLVIYGLHSLNKAVKKMQCSDELSRDMLDALCKLYEKNKVGGNLCDDICKTGSIKLKKCLNYRGGKKIFLATWNMKTIILKSKKGYLRDYDPIWYQDPNKPNHIYPSVEEFAMTIRTTIQDRISIKLPGRLDVKMLVNQMWSVGYDEYFNNPFQKNPRESGLDSIYSLLQQDEYLMMKHFQGSQFFPDIYGTCGHFYAMEFVPPGTVLDPAIFSFKDESTWNQRRIIALKLLDLVYHLEHNFHQPLHMCDVKNENFGLTADGGVKAIDVDMAYFDENLKFLMNQENCTKHSDCDFFDCRGWCDFKTGYCSDRRINNNLQAVCSDVFQQKLGNAFKGLLRRPPRQLVARFNEVLEECANPSAIQEADIRLKAPDETYWKLYNLLLESNADLLPVENGHLHDHEH